MGICGPSLLKAPARLEKANLVAEWGIPIGMGGRVRTTSLAACPLYALPRYDY